jgi:hypothetical protein
VLAVKLEIPISEKGAGQQPRFTEDLKSITDSKDHSTRVRE